MSAAELREAASLMRERAEAVPASPWFTIDVPVGRPAGEREWVVDSETRLIAGNIGVATDPAAEPLAEHIASWHPAVALAVADWLDRIAEHHGPVVECGNAGCRRRELSGMHCPDPCEEAHEDCPAWADALAVARAYLNTG